MKRIKETDQTKSMYDFYYILQREPGDTNCHVPPHEVLLTKTGGEA